MRARTPLLPHAPGPVWRIAAWLWLLVLCVVLAHQLAFWQSPRLNADALALLPRQEQSEVLRLASVRMSNTASRRVVVLVGASGWAASMRAAQAAQTSLMSGSGGLHGARLVEPSGDPAALEPLRPWKDRLLTARQRQWLDQASDAQIVQAALEGLLRPGPGLVDRITDPLALWPSWWLNRLAQGDARLRDGRLWVADGATDWIVLMLEVDGPVFRVDGETPLAGALREALASARRAQPDARLLAAGLPLHAEAAAAQASVEVSTIGWGSLAAVLLLVWLAFRSARPIVLVSLSLLAGLGCALTVTDRVFGEVHLLTLVFGASLIGVAEDYGIHYFASRQATPQQAPAQVLSRLFAGLLLALLTTVVAYGALGLAPLPGLRQMAVFSATGLVAAFLTVLCWYPWLDGRAGARPTRLSTWLGGNLGSWPRLSPRATGLVVGLVALLTALAAALGALHWRDDVRQLQNSPAALLADQREIGRVLTPPSVAQYFVVQGRDTDELLRREEALTARLEALAARGGLAAPGGHRALSDWVPSLARQQQDARRVERANRMAVQGLSTHLGEALTPPVHAAQPLTLDIWLRQPIAAAARDLWLGPVDGQPASVVQLRGLNHPAQLAELSRIASGLDGVVWVDRAAQATVVLTRYSHAMAWLLVLGHGLVLLALWVRYRERAWRAWVPTLLASAATVGLLAALGQPVQLFTVLALTLLLGIGVDYGIFLLEHPEDGSAWLAVALGACSTWLALGLLALSRTPALHAFGLAMLIGIPIVWLLSPLMRPPAGRVMPA